MGAAWRRASRGDGRRRASVPRRRLRGALAVGLLAAGVVLLAEAAVTLAWQEPLTALRAKGAQKALAQELGTLERHAFDAGELAALERRVAAAGERTLAALEGERMAYLAAVRARKTPIGGALGRIEIPKLGAEFVVAQGTDAETLKTGPGHYLGTALPGQRGTVALAGHRTTYLAPFRHVDRLARGDPIVFTTPYGRFRYAVEDVRVVSPDAVEVLRRVRHDRLVLTTCHPLFSEAERLVVFARLVGSEARGAAVVRSVERLVRNRFNARRAFAFLRWQVRLGPRPAGSAASRRLSARLRALLPRGRFQRFGRLRNVFGTIPGRDPRRVVVVGAHYDTKDIPGFVGANDGASGTASVLELARTFRPRQLRPTVVFAFFDGEESIPGTSFAATGLRGSRRAAPRFAHAEAMILLDFVGDKRLRIPRELYSDPVLWARLRLAAARVGAAPVFPNATQPPVLDDHVPFLRRGVPAINLIDFDFPCWHRRCDNLSAVSARSLDLVGETVVALLESF